MSELTQLGAKVEIPASPLDAVIECITLNDTLKPTWVRLDIPEFTSLCPITKAPDFGHIIIDYKPNKRLIESKSLKLFIGSFRNHGYFHENIACIIGERLCMVASPYCLRVVAQFRARGGISIQAVYQHPNIGQDTFNMNAVRPIPEFR